MLVFIREAIQKFPHLRSLITEKLIDTFAAIRSVKVHRAALWILGEYVTNSKDVLQVIEAVNQALGEVPMVEAEQRRLTGDTNDTDTDGSVPKAAGAVTTNKVTSDGTYATQSAFSLAPYVFTHHSYKKAKLIMFGLFIIELLRKNNVHHCVNI